MCHPACIEFVAGQLLREDVAGARVLEVGSRDVNGSVRPVVEELGPESYLGVDIEAGAGVDEICNANQLVARYGPDSFDLVLSTELVEHVRDWRAAFGEMKRVLRPGGELLVTTRSRGFGVHGFPHDYWRYSPCDMRLIFADFELLTLKRDPLQAGVFVKARKPLVWKPVDLGGIALYSVVTNGRAVEISRRRELAFTILHEAHMTYRRVLPERIRATMKRTVASMTEPR